MLCLSYAQECLDNVFYLFEKHNPLQKNWQGWAVQMLGGSTWNGLGRVVRSTMLIVLATILLVIESIFTLIAGFASFGNEEWSKHAWLSAKADLAYMGFIFLGCVYIVYNLIRAIPIIGYPATQGIHLVSKEFYELECMKSLSAGHKALVNEVSRR